MPGSVMPAAARQPARREGPALLLKAPHGSERIPHLADPGAVWERQWPAVKATAGVEQSGASHVQVSDLEVGNCAALRVSRVVRCVEEELDVPEVYQRDVLADGGRQHLTPKARGRGRI